MSQKELVRRVQEELKKSNYKEKEKTSSPAKGEKSSQASISKDDCFESSYDLENIKIKNPKKFSLKEKWKNFINEEDDEFSIFSSIKDDSKKKEDTRNLEISKSLEDSEKTFENTLSTPKIDIENAIKKSEEEKKKKAKEAEEEKKSKEIIPDKKDHDKIKASDEEKVTKDSKASEKVKPLEKEAATPLKEKKSKNLKALFSFKDKGEKPVKEINSVDSKLDKVIEEDLSNKVSHVETKISQKSMKGLDKVLDFLSKITNKISNYIGDFGSKESKIVIGIGALLNAIALLIGSGSFRFILILFLILKMVFDYFEFYLPLNIASDRDDIDTSYPEVKKFALINWIICKVFLFLGFLISPFGGFLKYNMLQALTAMPLATFLLVVLSVLIAITLYSREFIGRSKINFIGWYAIAFTLFELLFKMIWFIINFIFVTLF